MCFVFWAVFVIGWSETDLLEALLVTISSDTLTVNAKDENDACGFRR